MCPSSPAWGHGLWHGTIAPLALGVSIWAWAGHYDPEAPVGFSRALPDFEPLCGDHALSNDEELGGVATRTRVRNLAHLHGEPTDTSTEEFIISTFGHRACSMYGTTEVGVILVSYPGAPDIKVKPRSLGKAVPGLRVEVHNAAGTSGRTERSG